MTVKKKRCPTAGAYLLYLRKGHQRRPRLYPDAAPDGTEDTQ